jgi:hypothetical protein
MKPVTYNGYTFDYDPEFYPGKMDETKKIHLHGVPYTFLCKLSDITEEQAAQIYPRKEVITHIPSDNFFIKPVVNPPELFDTHKEALIRYVQFHFKMQPDYTVVLKEFVEAVEVSVKRVVEAISRKRFPLNDEKATQHGIMDALMESKEPFERERYLDAKNIIDFLTRSGVGIEVKIKGTKVSIYKQLERYSKFLCIEALVLVSNVSMALPEEINGKPLYYIKLSNAYL